MFASATRHTTLSLSQAESSTIFRRSSRFLTFHESRALHHHPQSQPQSQRHHFQTNEPIRPYSDSLPSPGYEWCSRCQIRMHKFQKAQGYPNACLDAPRLFGLGVCASARQYYKQQATQMIFLSLFCFAAAPIYNANATHAQEEAPRDF